MRGGRHLTPRFHNVRFSLTFYIISTFFSGRFCLKWCMEKFQRKFRTFSFNLQKWYFWKTNLEPMTKWKREYYIGMNKNCNETRAQSHGMTHVFPPTRTKFQLLFFSFFNTLKLQGLLLMELFWLSFVHFNKLCRAWHEHTVSRLLLKKEPRTFQGFQKLRAKYAFVSFLMPYLLIFLLWSISSSHSILHHKGKEAFKEQNSRLSGNELQFFFFFRKNTILRKHKRKRRL